MSQRDILSCIFIIKTQNTLILAKNNTQNSGGHRWIDSATMELSET